MAASRRSLVVAALVALLAPAAATGANQVLYSCTINYWQLPLSDVRLDVRHLLPRGQPTGSTSGQPVDVVSSEDEQFDRVELRRLSASASLKELEASGIDPRLPFMFFINGFNQGAINSTNNWMFQVGKTMARFRLRNRDGSSLRANVVFLSWYIENLFATNLFGLVPAYYKTMANYESILSFVGANVMHLIDYVDYVRAKSGIEQSQESRRRYFSSFEFYGHSLGAHIISDAIVRLKELRPDLRFGKLVGLDPAVPCFSSRSHGISAAKTAQAVDEVSIVHSNAAFAGVTSNRARNEIVLNGGTFQPNCTWLDFECHHTRATDIFNYIDDSCQMVAYKCSRYEQFKCGACETGELPGESNYLLVNLPEQHVDSGDLLDSTESHNLGKHPIRQVAEPADAHLNRNLRSVSEKLAARRDAILSSQASRSRLHYVNTNPAFRSGARTHCLQHYQLRLFIMSSDEQQLLGECRLDSFYERSSGVDVELYFLNDDRDSSILRFVPEEREAGHSRQAHQKNLINILDGRLHSGLVQFEGSPRVFTGARIANVDFGRWSRCLANQNINSSVDFVLDVAFMSHLKRG